MDNNTTKNFKLYKQSPDNNIDNSNMNCEEFNDFIQLELDQDLDMFRSSRLDKHLEVCQSCNKSYKEFVILKQHAKLLSQATIPTAVSKRLRERLAKELDVELDGFSKR